MPTCAMAHGMYQQKRSRGIYFVWSALLTLSSASRSLSWGMLVQVKCIIVSTHTCRKAQRLHCYCSDLLEQISRAMPPANITASWQTRPEHTMFCILPAISKVRSAVVPPAPQVISQKVGSCVAMRSILSNRFSTPYMRNNPCSRQIAHKSDLVHMTVELTSSVRGGKNSNEKKVSPAFWAAFILSTTFMMNGTSGF